MKLRPVCSSAYLSKVSLTVLCCANATGGARAGQHMLKSLRHHCSIVPLQGLEGAATFSAHTIGLVRLFEPAWASVLLQICPLLEPDATDRLSPSGTIASGVEASRFACRPAALDRPVGRSLLAIAAGSYSYSHRRGGCVLSPRRGRSWQFRCSRNAGRSHSFGTDVPARDLSIRGFLVASTRARPHLCGRFA